MSLIAELRKRNVFRVATAYIVLSWLVLQVADVLLGNLSLPEGLFPAIVTVLAIGFPVVVIFAWIFELTPEGIKREHEIDRSNSITRQTGRKLDFLIIGLLVLAVGYFAYDKFVLDAKRDAVLIADALKGLVKNGTVGDSDEEVQPNSIAVLPFTNMSTDPANEAFTAGIHDDLLTQLSHIEGLSVTSRTSVEQYRDTQLRIREIVAELRVAHILEGGVQRVGDTVRINLQLIDALNDDHLWAEVFERKLTAENIFAVQRDITSRVAKSLQATLTSSEREALDAVPTQSMAAYDLYLLGRYHYYQYSTESVKTARDYFEQAIEVDPEYVLAYSGLADSALAMNLLADMSGETAIPVAREAVNRAMMLDDSNSAVWASKGFLLLTSGNFEEAEAALIRALELDERNFTAWSLYGGVLYALRRFTDALEARKRAYALEPMSPVINRALGDDYWERGDWIRARQHYERLDQVDDLHPAMYQGWIADTYYFEGHVARALMRYREIASRFPGSFGSLASVAETYLILGDEEEARYWFSQTESVNPYDYRAVQMLYAEGDYKAAVIYLEDKLALNQHRRNLGILLGLFQSSYFGGQIEQARNYLEEYLSHFGGRIEPRMSDNNFRELLIAAFWLEHGDLESGEPERGERLVEQVIENIVYLQSQDFRSPFLFRNLARAHGLLGNDATALDELARAVEYGDRERVVLESSPWFRKLDAVQLSAINLEIDALLEKEKEKLAQTELATYVPYPVPVPVTLSVAAMDRFLGDYSDGNAYLQFSRNDEGQLQVQIGQGRITPLLPMSETMLYSEMVPSQRFEFFFDDHNRVSHVLLRWPISTLRFIPIEPLPERIELPREKLQQFVGRFMRELPSAGSDYTLEVDYWEAEVFIDEDGILWFDLDNQQALQLVPFSETEFLVQGFDARIRFVVDPSNGSVKNLVTRQDGRDWIWDRL